jgi:hypothetical protein
MLEAKIPEGPLEQKWSHYRSTSKLVNPGNRRKLHVIVVGTGLAGSSLAASLGDGLSGNLFLLSGYRQASPFRGCPRRSKRLQELQK